MVDKETVKNVARVARLHLTEGEVEKFQKELEDILNTFAILEKAPPAEPAFQPIDVKNATRTDKVEPSLTQEQALANTKEKEKGYFKGPKTM